MEKTSVLQAFIFQIPVREQANILETTLFLNVRVLNSHARVSLYFKFGAGADYVTADLTIYGGSGTLHLTDSHLWAGFLAGAGVSVRYGRSNSLVLEAVLHDVATDHDPVNFFTLSLGGWFS